MRLSPANVILASESGWSTSKRSISRGKTDKREVRGRTQVDKRQAKGRQKAGKREEKTGKRQARGKRKQAEGVQDAEDGQRECKRGRHEAEDEREVCKRQPRGPSAVMAVQRNASRCARGKWRAMLRNAPRGSAYLKGCYIIFFLFCFFFCSFLF
jgi:hypothetical protein